MKPNSMLSVTATPTSTLSPHIKNFCGSIKQHQQGEIPASGIDLFEGWNLTIFLVLLSFLSSEAQLYLEKSWKKFSGVEIISSFSPQITKCICQI